eukprot:5101094-Prymnesium_polylepis.1
MAVTPFQQRTGGTSRDCVTTLTISRNVSSNEWNVSLIVSHIPVSFLQSVRVPRARELAGHGGERPRRGSNVRSRKNSSTHTRRKGRDESGETRDERAFDQVASAKWPPYMVGPADSRGF